MAETDDIAFEAFIASHRPRLVRRAMRIVRDAAAAEDVVQDALAGAWRNRGQVAAEKRPAYAYRAVELNALKHRLRRRPAVPLEAAGEPMARPVGDEPAKLDPVEVERAIAQLPPAQQTVIRMKYYMGLTFERIGQTLALSTNTAASRCRYALAALRKSLGRQR